MNARRLVGWSLLIAALLVLPSLAAATELPGTTGVRSSPIRAVPGTATMPTGSFVPTGGMPAGIPALSPVRPATGPALTIIYPNGTISNLTAPISVENDVYSLTASFTGGIEDERNGSTLDGDGYGLQVDTSLTVGVTVFQASNVTVSGFRVVGANVEGYEFSSATDGALIGSHALTDRWSVDIEASLRTTVSDNNFSGSWGIDAQSSNYTYIGSNLLAITTDWGVVSEFCTNTEVDDNAFSMSGQLGAVLAYDSFDSVEYNEFSGDDLAEYLFSDSQVYSVGNTFDGASSGLEVVDSDQVRSIDDSGWGTENGIVVAQSDEATFESDVFNGSIVEGLDISGSTDISVFDSSINDSVANSTEIQGSSDIYLQQDNLSGYGEYGLIANVSTEVEVEWVNASNAPLGTGTGFWFNLDTESEVFESDANFTGSGFSGTGGGQLWVYDSNFTFDSGLGALVLEDVAGANVGDDNLSDAYSNGMYAEDASGLYLDATNLSNSLGNGLICYECSHSEVDDTLANEDAGSYGFLFENGGSLTLNGDTASDAYSSYLTGFAFYDLSTVSIENCSASFVNEGFDAEFTNTMSVVANNFTESYLGFYLYYVGSSTFLENNVSADDEAFSLDQESSVAIYQNDFEGDAGWLNYASLSSIRWDDGYPGGGNYWSNLTGPDVYGGPGQNLTGSDAIVDVPMVINATNVDRYPLVHPWTASTVQFVETGLAPGTGWGLTVGGVDLFGGTPTLTYWNAEGANGSADYQLDNVSGYRPPTPASGTVPLDGSTSNVSIAFTAFDYRLTVSASGLANGTSWSVWIDGQNLSSTTPWINLSVPNGSYAYTAHNVSGYALTTPYGTATIDGASTGATVIYVQIHPPSSGNGSGNSTGNHTGGGGSGGGGSGGSGGGGSGGSGGSGGGSGGGGGGGGGGTPGGTTTTSNQPSSGYSSSVVLALVLALILASVLAVLGFGLYGRARRNGASPPTPQPWTPPPSTPAVAPAVAVAPVAAVTAPPRPPAGAAGGAAPDWSEDGPDGS